MKRIKYSLDLAISFRGQQFCDLGYRSSERITFRDSLNLVHDEGFMWGIGGDWFYSAHGQVALSPLAQNRTMSRTEYKLRTHNVRLNVREEMEFEQEMQDRAAADEGPYGRNI